MTITHTGKGTYLFDGDVIEGKILFPLYDGQKLNAEIWATK